MNKQLELVFAPWERVFQTLELAFLVFAYLGVDDVTSLLSTCRFIFYSAAASRWKHTTSVMPLLRLLPCTEIGTIRGYYRYPTQRGRNFTFHKPLLDSDFRRFSIYALYITHLDLWQAPDIPVTISGWKALLDYVNSGHVLLPNLITLSIKSEDSCRGMLPYPWIAAFAHSSLRHLYVGRRLGVSQHVGCAILDHVTRLCPDLAALELHIVHEGVEEQGELVLPKLDMIHVDWVGRFLQLARCLESLATNSYVFDVYLHHISQLPLLRRLEVHRHGIPDKIATCLPDDTFPSLCELQLGGFTLPEIESLWSMSPLVKHIAALEIPRVAYTSNNSQSTIFSISLSPERFLSALLPECPKLTIIRLGLEEEHSHEMRIDESTLRVLSQHPLRELSIQNITPVIGFQDPSIELLACLFPHLEILRWQKLYVSYDELHHTLKMPKLGHLAVLIQLRRIDSVTMGSLPWPSITTRNSELKIFETTPSYFSPGSWFRTIT
ncbi:hypothetical protein FRC12_000541 [Ceratobasidium sp. 428]|nr:hypothetical protein FRC12_000541 [Ceratobasidium sp. 428]